MLLFHSFLFQDPFNKREYELTGLGSATTYFKIDDRSGRITVARKIDQDTETNYTVSSELSSSFSV